jgi:hypothetical protein
MRKRRGLWLGTVCLAVSAGVRQKCGERLAQPHVCVSCKMVQSVGRWLSNAQANMPLARHSVSRGVCRGKGSSAGKVGEGTSQVICKIVLSVTQS